MAMQWGSGGATALELRAPSPRGCWVLLSQGCRRAILSFLDFGVSILILPTRAKGCITSAIALNTRATVLDICFRFLNLEDAFRQRNCLESLNFAFNGIIEG